MIIAPADCVLAACPHAHSWHALSQTLARRKAAGGIPGQGTILPHMQSLARSTRMARVPGMLLLWGLLTDASAFIAGSQLRNLCVWRPR